MFNNKKRQKQSQAGEPGLPGQPGELGTDGGGRGGTGGEGGRGGTGVASNIGSNIIKYIYLFIVVAASITLLFLLLENRELVRNIQNDRKQVTFDLCLEQNARNNQLNLFIDEQPSFNPSTEHFVRKFINLSAPKRNCDQVVINLFGSKIND